MDRDSAARMRSEMAVGVEVRSLPILLPPATRDPDIAHETIGELCGTQIHGAMPSLRPHELVVYNGPFQLSLIHH